MEVLAPPSEDLDTFDDTGAAILMLGSRALTLGEHLESDGHRREYRGTCRKT